ncbi:MAG: PorV/PorQ family protein [Elusimicrobia bacterium]|nr:PorV/PorQ family protein [Elusimicrobiota bacterium]
MNNSQHRRGESVRAALSIVFALASILYPLAPVFAGGPGSTAVQVLKTDISPRAMGMGGGFVSVADDIYSVTYNPAGLGRLYLPEISATYLSGFADAKLQFLGFGMPLPINGLIGLDKPGIAVSAIFSQSGDFTYRRINDDGTIFSRSMDAEGTKVFSLSYGERVYSQEMKIEGYEARIDQYLGLSAKYVKSELLETYSASAIAFDAGWLLVEPKLGLACGASLSNYGGGMTYLKETYPLPSVMRLGLSWQRPTIMDQSVLLALEYDIYTNEGLKNFKGGLEYHFQKILNARLGYKAVDDNKGLTMGVGVHHEGFALDFAMSLANEVFNSSQVSFSYKFAGWRIRDYKKAVHYRNQDEKAPPQKKAKKPAKKEPARPKKAQEPGQKKDSDFFMLY